MRVAGIPVRIEWPFFIFAGLLGLDFRGWRILAWIVIVFVSVLVHEFGHALLLRAFGQRPTVHITPISGLTHPERPLPRGRNIAVSLAGSVFAFAVLGVPAIFLRQQALHFPDGWAFQHPNWFWVVYFVAQVNIWWSIFNLLPLLPLDGGHVSESIIGPFRARVVAVVVGVLAAIYVDSHSNQRYIALFLVILAIWNGVEAYRLRQGSAGGFLPGGLGMRPNPQPPPAKKPKPPKASKPAKGSKRGRGRLAPVPDLPHEPSDMPPKATPRTTAQLVSAAWEALRAGDGETAALLIDSIGDAKGVPLYLRASIAASTGERAQALSQFEEAFLAGPPPNLVAAGVVADSGLADDLAIRLLARNSAGVDAAGTLATHLHFAGRYPAAARVGERVFADGRASKPQTAFEIACAWAQANDPDKGLQWLVMAVDAGFTAPNLIDSEADLAPVRALPGYVQLRERLNS